MVLRGGGGGNVASLPDRAEVVSVDEVATLIDQMRALEPHVTVAGPAPEAAQALQLRIDERPDKSGREFGKLGEISKGRIEP